MIPTEELFLRYNEIYTPSFIIHPYETDGGYGVTLNEDDGTAKLKELKVYNIPKKTILLPLSKYSKLHLDAKVKDILKADLGIFKCCDYLFITMSNEELYMIFIEMKSKTYHNGDIKKQFKGAACFIEYCNAAIERFCAMPSLKSVPLNTRYFLISLGKFNKRPTGMKMYRRQSSPDEFFHYTVGSDKAPSVHFGVFLQQIRGKR